MALLVAAFAPPDSRNMDLAGVATSGALVRYLGRGVYESLAAHPCRASPSAQLRAVKREEAAFVAALESTLVGPVADNVALAKEDVAFEGESSDRFCWGDEMDQYLDRRDQEWFFSHVETFREELRRPNFRSQALKGLDRHSMPKGPEFRWLVREVLKSLRWECTEIDRRPFLAAARPMVDRFTHNMRRTKFAAQFEVARADVAILDLVIVSNCSFVPTRGMTALDMNERLSTLSKRIAAAERIAGS
ncbi:hypothetical protein [uncultured Sphingomonas sp.]|uniref:hypothetical protein n=1 Tax=uncultured Sphingomonas sp. TaxID=158754 RepID=UPI0025EE4412|nr:hypothetical protein [uncultured Sphingomonas sp.]